MPTPVPNIATGRFTRLADLPTKHSWCASQPFQRLKVKIRPEIIRMHMPAVAPATGRAPAATATTTAGAAPGPGERWAT